MTWVGAGFDMLLAATLIWSAVRVVSSEDLVLAVALFIVFGLLMTLAWVRLSAPNIALAEAGIGAGFSGALLFAALARLRRLKEDADESERAAQEPGKPDDDA